MHGNAWQWCADWWEFTYYAESPIDDPKGPDHDVLRVIRGGSWADGPEFNRSAARWAAPPEWGLSSGHTGFRVAMTAPAPVSAEAGKK